MGWKGTLRSVQAAARKAEREAERRRRELERHQKQVEKMEELERAAYEVEVYENFIDVLLTVHQECSDSWDWEAIKSCEPPTVPDRESALEEAAKAERDEYTPSLLDRTLRRVDSKREELARAVEDARNQDETNYQEALVEYEQEIEDWQAACELAGRVLSGEHEAYHDAIRQTNPFSDVAALGSSIEFDVRSESLVEAVLRVHAEDVIPSEVKSLLKSGKLSVKQMPKTRFYAMYQDHVCGCVLRIARELLALLPIEAVTVSAVSDFLNTQTGHMEEKTILSVAIPRETLETLNFEGIDPSDSLANFVHRMKFLKTKGFRGVEPIDPSEVQLARSD
jgi:hypothetical protein